MEGKEIGCKHSVKYLVTLKTKFSLNTPYTNTKIVRPKFIQ